VTKFEVVFLLNNGANAALCEVLSRVVYFLLIIS